MFRRLTRRAAVDGCVAHEAARPSHVVTSEFSTSICRFVLECTCGVTFDTNYIDEALEWREMHQAMAPLNDQLASVRT